MSHQQVGNDRGATGHVGERHTEWRCVLWQRTEQSIKETLPIVPSPVNEGVCDKWPRQYLGDLYRWLNYCQRGILAATPTNSNARLQRSKAPLIPSMPNASMTMIHAIDDMNPNPHDPELHQTSREVELMIRPSENFMKLICKGSHKIRPSLTH